MLIDLLFINCEQVVTCEPLSGPVPVVNPEEPMRLIRDGAVAVDNGMVVDVGTSECLERKWRAREVVKCRGRVLSPGLVDPHSHLIHAGSRVEANEARILGRSVTRKRDPLYETVDATVAASDEQLRRDVIARLDLFVAHGTTTVEAKTGYGLTAEAELRLLQVLASVDHPANLVLTFLAAHRPTSMDAAERAIQLDAIKRVIPQVRKLASFFDLNCDPKGFTPEECRRLADLARDAGILRFRIHADQNGMGGGANLAGDLRAATADHLDYLTESAARVLAEAGTIAVLTPTLDFHIPRDPSPRRDGWRSFAERVELLRRTGVPIAISADYNPGSSPTVSQQFAMQVAARAFRLPFQSIWYLSTLNPAFSLGLGETCGSISIGKRADLVVWNVPDSRLVVNDFGYNMVSEVYISGERAYAARETLNKRPDEQREQRVT